MLWGVHTITSPCQKWEETIRHSQAIGQPKGQPAQAWKKMSVLVTEAKKIRDSSNFEEMKQENDKLDAIRGPWLDPRSKQKEAWKDILRTTGGIWTWTEYYMTVDLAFSLKCDGGTCSDRRLSLSLHSEVFMGKMSRCLHLLKMLLQSNIKGDRW